MRTVECQIEETEVMNDSNHYVPGIMATCNVCSHTTESYGTSDASRKRCLALMREECPMGEKNFYKVEEK